MRVTRGDDVVQENGRVGWEFLNEGVAEGEKDGADVAGVDDPA